MGCLVSSSCRGLCRYGTELAESAPNNLPDSGSEDNCSEDRRANTPEPVPGTSVPSRKMRGERVVEK